MADVRNVLDEPGGLTSTADRLRSRSRAQAGLAFGLALVVSLAACGDDSASGVDSTTATIDPTTTSVDTTINTSTIDDTTIDTTIETTTTTSVDTTTMISTTTTDITTTTTGVRLADEAAVVQAYLDHWPVFDAFLSGDPPGDPADYFTGERLADLPRSVADFAERGLEIQGEAIFAPGEVTIIGDEAFFTDCQLDTTSAVSRTTGEVVVGPATTPQAVAVELIRSGGIWKVASVVYGDEGSCVQ